MTRPEIELRPLAGAAAAALVGLVALAAVWHLGGVWLDERADDFHRARAQLSAAASQYRNASDDQAVYQRYAARFRDMGERGWIGPEQRLGWIESLQAINRELKLPTLRYDIEQRATVEGAGSGRLTLHRTPMTLTLGALHEGDIIALLERLGSAGAGLMSVHGCELVRAGERVRFDIRSANVDVRCALDWYTLQIDAPPGSRS